MFASRGYRRSGPRCLRLILVFTRSTLEELPVERRAALGTARVNLAAEIVAAGDADGDAPLWIYPHTIDGAFSGSVAMVDGRMVITAASDYYYWEYLGNDLPGVDYTMEVGFRLNVSVPEPASLAVLLLGGLTVMRRPR